MLKLNNKATIKARKERSNQFEREIARIVDEYAAVNEEYARVEKQRDELQSQLRALHRDNPALLLRSQRYMVAFDNVWVDAYRVPKDPRQTGFNKLVTRVIRLFSDNNGGNNGDQ